jgi:ferrochelatase
VPKPHGAQQTEDTLKFSTQMRESRFGFSSFAEQWNGRLAMMGFVIGLGTELLTGQGIISQISHG